MTQGILKTIKSIQLPDDLAEKTHELANNMREALSSTVRQGDHGMIVVGAIQEAFTYALADYFIVAGIPQQLQEKWIEGLCVTLKKNLNMIIKEERENGTE